MIFYYVGLVDVDTRKVVMILVRGRALLNRVKFLPIGNLARRRARASIGYGSTGTASCKISVGRRVKAIAGVRPPPLFTFGLFVGSVCWLRLRICLSEDLVCLLAQAADLSVCLLSLSLSVGSCFSLKFL